MRGGLWIPRANRNGGGVTRWKYYAARDANLRLARQSNCGMLTLSIPLVLSELGLDELGRRGSRVRAVCFSNRKLPPSGRPIRTLRILGNAAHGCGRLLCREFPHAIKIFVEWAEQGFAARDDRRPNLPGVQSENRVGRAQERAGFAPRGSQNRDPRDSVVVAEMWVRLSLFGAFETKKNAPRE